VYCEVRVAAKLLLTWKVQITISAYWNNYWENGLSGQNSVDNNIKIENCIESNIDTNIKDSVFVEDSWERGN
jgi:hypothetical protein